MSRTRRLQWVSLPLALVALSHCSSPNAVTCTDPALCGAAGSATAGNPAASAGASGAGSSAAGQAGTVAGSSAVGGALASGGSASSAGAATAGNGTTAGTNGLPPQGGAAGSGAGGSAGASAAGASAAGTNAGGSAGSGAGGSSAGGSAGSSAGGAGGAGPIVDQNGQGLAKPGDSKTKSREYLNLGDFRVLNNKWGSDELGCNTTMKVFVNNDKSFGWSFDRPTCGGNKGKPDYPEVEFGIHPFGSGSALATSPSFRSTTLLPLQIKDIQSASITLDSLNASFQKGTTWNVDFELWLSQKNPVTDAANPGVYAEVIVFWGWKDDWACDKSGSVTAGDKTYSLCHQDDGWANGQWRYFQFRANGGPFTTYSGKADVKAFLDYLVNTRSYSKDLWVTRLEVGSELDDNTAGSVTMKNVTFEVNGVSKSAQYGQ